MIKTIVIGLWACGITIGAEIGAQQWREASAARAAAAPAAPVESRRTKEINIPKIRDGVIKGYIVTILNYTVDLNVLKSQPLPLDAIVTDEGFRYLYGDETVDFDHLEKFDIAKMNKFLVESCNARLGAKAVRDIGVQEFTFVSNVEAKARL